VSIDIKIDIPNWVKGAILIGVGCIIISAIRGCHNNKATLAENVQLKEANKILIQRAIKDSLDQKNTQEEYTFSDSIHNHTIEMQQDALDAANDTLDKANNRINKLIIKYRPATVNADTNVTLVPNEYINECSQCFTELEGQQKRIKVARDEMSDLQQSLNSRINNQQLRINELTKEKQLVKNNLNDCLKNDSINLKKFEPRRRLYWSMGVMSINSVLPNAAGLGLMYQDRRYRIVGFRMYTSEYGSVKALDVHLPLSFR